MIEHELSENEYFCPVTGVVHGADAVHQRIADGMLLCIDCGAELKTPSAEIVAQ
jgi:hypothetical protein